MTLTQTQRSLIEKARNVGNSDMAVPLSDEASCYLVARIAHDLNIQEWSTLLYAFSCQTVVGCSVCSSVVGRKAVYRSCPNLCCVRSSMQCERSCSVTTSWLHAVRTYVCTLYLTSNNAASLQKLLEGLLLK